jgi:uncharacterized membrane protein
MVVLIVLFGSLVFYRVLGVVGVVFFAGWMNCERFALATMFLFTAVAHFAPIKKDMIAMVPPSFPRPDLLVFVTGVLEFAGAVGLLIPARRMWAAWGLIALLVAMFPANVSAARRGLKLGGRPVTPLWIRAPMQVLFVFWAWWVR